MAIVCGFMAGLLTNLVIASLFHQKWSEAVVNSLLVASWLAIAVLVGR